MIVNGYTIEPNANLTGAYLTGANLAGADLTGARCDIAPDGWVLRLQREA